MSLVILSDRLSRLILKAETLAKSSSAPLGVREGLQRLKSTILRIRDVLDDAEERETREVAVRNWLTELQGVAYYAEELLGTEEIGKTIGKRKRMLEVRSISDFHIKSIGETFDKMEMEAVVLRLRKRPTVSKKDMPQRTIADESFIYGREDDKEKVIKLLLSTDKPSRDNIPVITITGTGGVGKTTLAQLVYNDQRVCNYFSLRASVCVSERFDVTRLTKAIVKCITKKYCNGRKLSTFLDTLRMALYRKSFLLVLDDVWNVDPIIWNILRSPFVGAGTVKILRTARSESVGRITQAENIYHLQGLCEDDCWLLFKKYDFDTRDFVAHTTLLDIGKEIIRKCGGLPLAVKIIGGLLRYECDEGKWINILHSDMWELDESINAIPPALRISYDHMPAHLKPCFAYCSLFPKDYKFKKDQLVRMWMAQGFIEPSGSKTLEDMGSEYFDDLQRRLFFQRSITFKDEPADTFGMHHLIHDLCRSISGKEYCAIEDEEKVPEEVINILHEVRHFSLASHKPRVPLPAVSLQTYIFTHNCRRHGRSHKEIPNVVFQNNLFLRLLDLNCISIQELPDSIGNLRHLRYLCLKSRIKWLPESLGHLYNLQTLDLSHCTALRKLPKAIGNLVNLRHLDLPTMVRHLDLPTMVRRESSPDLIVSSVHMPPGIGKLVNLQTLVGIHFGRDCGIRELKDLVNLRGNLCISGLRNMTNVEDAKKANLIDKKYLQILQLEWNDSEVLDEGGDSDSDAVAAADAGDVDYYDDNFVMGGMLDSPESAEETALAGVAPEGLEEGVLESLQPHTNLTELVIKGYDGSRFPRWIGDPSFFKLTTLTLMGGEQNNCNLLPPLGQLPYLRCLFIGWMCSIHTVGREFCCLAENVVVNGAFPSLEELTFNNMLKWELWCGVMDGDFARLRELKIVYCPKLRTLPILPSLTSLYLSDFTELLTVPTLPMLQHVDIRDCPGLNEWCERYRLQHVGVVLLEDSDDLPQTSSQFENTVDLQQTSSQFEKKADQPQMTSRFEKAVDLPGTGSRVDESTVYGREDDEKRVIELCLSDDCREHYVSVIRIVAAGGVGKTTLVNLVYNNSRVCEIFETRAWVCATERSDANGLTKAIIESLTGISCCLTELIEIQEAVREELMGRRFLLVLDNVCKEDLSFWSSLIVSLSVGAKGSIVIATTRNEMDSVIMGTMHSYDLNRLSENNCWLVFRQHAFDGKDDNVHPDLIEIGKQIITKCEGLPLAVKALGGLLCSVTNEKSWNAVLESDLWDTDETLPALRLSYDHLTMYLKRCFEYCSLFPKGYIFEKDHLVRLWMSQGFIEHKEGKRVEDVGIEYFDELLRRSFFQYPPICDPKEGKYVMHDFFHDLAQFVSVNECFRSENCMLSNIPETVHHTSLVPSEFEKAIQFEPFRESTDIHTYLLINRSTLKWDASLFHIENIVILNDLFLHCRCLRALDFSFTNIEVLPDSIANLKHLCYLGLNKTNIRRLPESVCSLYNLQTLELQHCSYLRELPIDTKNLANLRHLDVWKESGFVFMPPGIGQLTALQTLSTFNVGRDKWYCGMRELKDLVNLRGALCIGGLENVVSGEEAKEANLRMKKYLQTLTLQWFNLGGDLEGDESAGTDFEVLQSLQAHSNLEELIIRNYVGGQFPSWMTDPSFFKLISITLDNCYECSVLPHFGQLPSLRYLSIRKMGGVQCLGREFCGSDTMIMNGFPSLETLKLWEMSELEEWCGVEDGDFPCLRSLSISRCLKLRRLPGITSLVELSVHCCTKLPDLPTLPCLESLTIEGFQNLKSLSLLLNLPALKMLEINHCNQLSLVEGLSHLASVKQLKVIKCPKLHFSPNEQLPSMFQVVEIRRGCALLSEWCPYGFEEITDAHQASRKLVRQKQQGREV